DVQSLYWLKQRGPWGHSSFSGSESCGTKRDFPLSASETGRRVSVGKSSHMCLPAPGLGSADKCKPGREINEGEPPWPRWIMILDHGDERLQWIRQKIYAADSGPAFILQLVRHALPPCPGNVNFCTVAPVQIAGICWLITSSLACCIVGCQEDQTMRGV
ncbi:DNA ligase, partial [Dissostichus eleginoides]